MKTKSRSVDSILTYTSGTKGQKSSRLYGRSKSQSALSICASVHENLLTCPVRLSNSVFVTLMSRRQKDRGKHLFCGFVLHMKRTSCVFPLSLQSLLSLECSQTPLLSALGVPYFSSCPPDLNFLTLPTTRGVRHEPRGQPPLFLLSLLLLHLFPVRLHSARKNLPSSLQTLLYPSLRLSPSNTHFRLSVGSIARSESVHSYLWTHRNIQIFVSLHVRTMRPSNNFGDDSHVAGQTSLEPADAKTRPSPPFPQRTDTSHTQGSVFFFLLLQETLCNNLAAPSRRKQVGSAMTPTPRLAASIFFLWEEERGTEVGGGKEGGKESKKNKEKISKGEEE